MSLVIPAALMSDLVAAARQCQPQETCGLLLGTDSTVQRVVPLPNSDPQPEQGFVLEPQALAAALYQADADGLEVMGIYHSHPRSASFPSERDIKGAAQWPTVAQVIISLQGGRTHVQAWRMAPGQVERVPFHLTPQAADPGLSPSARAAVVGAACLALLILIGLSVSLLPAAPIITPVP